MEGVMRPVVFGAGGRRARRLLLLTGCLILGMLGLGTVEAKLSLNMGAPTPRNPSMLTVAAPVVRWAPLIVAA